MGKTRGETIIDLRKAIFNQAILASKVNITSSFEQYFHVALFMIILYKVGLTFKSVDKTLVCDHSNESY